MKIEIRSDCVVLDGYVNAVARDSRIMLDEYNNKFVEQITPGTFTRALQIATNIDCLLNHNESRKLASTSEGTLELYEDNIGLRANVTIRDSVFNGFFWVFALQKLFPKPAFRPFLTL